MVDFYAALWPDFTPPLTWSDIGTYTISYVEAYDFAGNSTKYETADLDGMGFQTTFEVTDAKVDNTAPTIENITLNQPYLDMGNNDNDTLFAEFTVNETGSGFSYGYVTIRSEDNSYAISSAASNSFTTEIYVGYGSTGIYDITNVSLYDIAGNVTTYDEAELTDLGLNHTFRVLGDGTQPGVEVSGTGGIDTIIGTTADEVFTLHLGEDVLEISSDWGHDTILDFIQGDDVLDFSETGLTYADLDVYDTSYGLFLYDESTGSDLLFQNFFGELEARDALFATTLASGGNDTLIATKLVHLDAGLGDDSIEITDDQFNSIDGGAGFDTLIVNTDDLDGIADIIDFNALTQRGALSNLEAIDITNGEADEISLSLADVLNMTDADNVLTLEGDATDTFNVAADGWTLSGTVVQGDSEYNQYTSADATLLIDQEIAVL